MKEFEELPVEQQQALVLDSQSFLKDYFTYRLPWQTTYSYLLAPVIDLDNSSFIIRVKSVSFANEAHIQREVGKEHPDFVYRDLVEINCEICVWKKNNLVDTNTFQHTFEHQFEYTVNEPLQIRRLEIFDEQRLLLRQFDDRIFDFYKLYLAEGEQTLFGRSGVQVRFERACYDTTLYKSFTPMFQWQELTRCVQRVRFSAGNAYLYKPYLENPEWYGHTFQDGMVYPSYSTLYDERYLIYCEHAYEDLYKFWDRVGDTIHDVVNSGVPDTAVDFARVIDQLERSGLYVNNPGFQWLLAFKKNEYTVFNTDRKRIVHYDTLSKTMQTQHMNSFSNLEMIRERQSWLEGRIGYFVQEFNNCIEGLNQLAIFIENLPPRKDP